MSKIHPLFRDLVVDALSLGNDKCEVERKQRSFNQWHGAGEPLVEEEPLPTWGGLDCEGIPYITIKESVLKRKDARIKELERENDEYQRERGLSGALRAKAKELEKDLDALRATWSTAYRANESRVKELEVKLVATAEIGNQWKDSALANARRNTELEAKLAEALRDVKDWVHFGKQTCNSSWNAALEEAAKKFEDGVNWEWTFKAFHIAKVIRARKK